MARVKNNYYNIIAGKPCYGAYQPSSLCDTCWAAELCIQETIRLDGYYDQQAERSWWDDYEGTYIPQSFSVR